MIRREPSREIGAPVSERTDLAAVHTGISDYYTAKIRKFGATPLGVDWTCLPTQELRFVQLLKVCDFTSPLSLNDLGCGYGAKALAPKPGQKPVRDQRLPEAHIVDEGHRHQSVSDDLCAEQVESRYEHGPMGKRDETLKCAAHREPNDQR